jgi:pyruvate,orthophosphate dikinase
VSLVYDLDYGHGLTLSDLSALIGGKAAGLAVMLIDLGLPVPPGFCITTAACNTYLNAGWPAGLEDEIRLHTRRLEDATGRKLGHPAQPLLVSVRSGAPVSMPGMMDTILNLGLNDETARGLVTLSGDPEFAADCHRRFRTMFTDIVGVARVPDDPWQQLRLAVEAVFLSWNSERARAYRAREGIADDLGTAVSVQAMVFGNWGDNSASGVLFTRNPATGEPALYGDLLFASQGEDVVAGTHETQPLAALDTRMPEVARNLRRYADALERHFADLCDVEFTIERGKLWLLQVRVGKRTPQAALRMAVDMAQDDNFPLSRREAVERVAAYLAHPPAVSLGPAQRPAPLTTGLGASPGIATGAVVISPQAALEAGERRPVILVRAETSPEDVPAMAHAAGVLTASGGLASHAAVIARGWGIPAVVGAQGLHISESAVVIGGRTLTVGETISIDGGTGEIFAGEVATRSTIAPEVATLLAWAEELGIDVGAGAGGDAAASTPEVTREPTADDAIHVLSIKASCSPEGLAAALMSTHEKTQTLSADLVATGVVEHAAGLLRLTAEGKRRARALVTADQASWGLSDAAAALGGFQDLNARVKVIVTAWQMKGTGGTQALNDHSDAAYDEAVLGQLNDVHRTAVAWLSSLGAAPDRFHLYITRLDRALQLVRGGDERFVSSPRVDSYHGAWFELHEDLIRLAGRTRADETAAGSA